MRDFIKKVLRDYTITESLDKPFKNLKEIEFTRYYLDEDNVKVNFKFKHEFNIHKLPLYLLDTEKLKNYFEISWSWNQDMENGYKTVYNWKRVTATAFKVIDMFLRKYNPELVIFKGRHPKMDIIYNYDQFLEILRNLFYFNYFVKNYDDKIYIIRKDVSSIYEGHIEKRSECDDCNETYEESREFWLHPNKRKRNMKGISRNDYIKDQRKRIFLKEFFLH